MSSLPRSSEVDDFDPLPLPHPHVPVPLVPVPKGPRVDALAVGRLAVGVEGRALAAGLDELQAWRVRQAEDAEPAWRKGGSGRRVRCAGEQEGGAEKDVEGTDDGLDEGAQTTAIASGSMAW